MPKRLTQHRIIAGLSLVVLVMLLALAVACGDDDDDDDDDDGATAVATTERTAEATEPADADDDEDEASPTADAGDVDPEVAAYAGQFCGEFDSFLQEILAVPGLAEAETLTDEQAAVFEGLANDFADGLAALDPPGQFGDWQDEFVAAIRDNAGDAEALLMEVELPDPPEEAQADFEAALQTEPACLDLQETISSGGP
ncbi:MAG TPA: hypothetical protein VNL92_05685 [Dehalococcoidia bacterium]|nr:hypothetical protein [Dehalococcoidia bacterium]